MFMDNYYMDAICKYEIKAESDIKSVVNHLLDDVKATHDVTEQKEFEIKLVMNELLTNCIKYCRVCVECPVLVEYEVEEKQLHFTVSDCGSGFDVKGVHYDDMDITSDKRLYAENGRGLFLANKLSTNLEFNEKGNEVTVSINLK